MAAGLARLWWLAVLLAAAPPLHAQSCPSAGDVAADSLARRYAPVLRFGPGERYFPTVPFFPAFDTIGGPGGFTDPARVAPLGKGGHISWDSLDAAYRKRVLSPDTRVTTFVPRNAAVFYRVRCLEGKQNKQVWGFLRNDPQSWSRSGLDTLYALGLRDAEFAVVEYYLYYMRDVGLEGHAHDIERILVFAPWRIDRKESIERGGKSQIAAEAGSQEGLTDSLRLLVGTGHSATTPNNILVLVNGEAATFSIPSVLIELGGHSAAPDPNRDNEFSPGLDINWNVGENIWGTRDAQAISGLGFFGRYQSWMTLPRHPGASVAMRVYSPQDAPALERALDSVTAPGVQQTADHPPVHRPDSVEHRRSDLALYNLVPVRLFQQLDQLVATFDTTVAGGDVARADSIVHLVNDSIRPRLRPGWDFGGLADTSYPAVAAAVALMRYWQLPMESSEGAIAASRTQIWRHEDYRGSPIESLKRRLYRPTFNGIQNAGDVGSLLTGNFTAYLGRGGQEFQLGILLPVVKSKLVIQGLPELQIGIYRRRMFGVTGEPTRVSLGLLYERHYKRTVSWYLRPLNYVRHRAELEGDPEASDFTVAFGMSVMPFFSVPNVLAGLAQRLRLRLGLRLDAKHWEPSLRRLEVGSTMYVR